ncbi:hypothetical protein SteCoe_11350 [Stentor coeruleus]|uniref:C2H2-type domain-containing protein n=1 Tax=Stentor coeruleus TaxID=5963 RepID=A0A1R2CDG5_9CILI|nr:hypothetical protein SteCoe_11350 [Stentor coeruleus]
MLKCSTWKCKEKPIKQCNNCNGLFLCDECIQNHSKKHEDKNIQYDIGDIEVKLSLAESIKLKQSIRESIKAIKNQKKTILSKSLALYNDIEKIVKSAIEYLDKMLKEYKDISKKKLFKEKDFIKAKKIISEFLVFDDPNFPKIDGVLTKNSKIIKNNIRKSSIFTMDYNYDLKIEGHRKAITRLAISSDDRFVVTGSDDCTVRLWNLHKKQQEIVFEIYSDEVTSVSISKDSHFIISSSYSSVRVWNLYEKRQEAVFYSEAISSAIISNDNQFIIYTSNFTLGPMENKVIIRSLIDNKYEVKLKGHIDSINCVAITSDNQFIISGSGSYSETDDNTIRIWNLIEKKQEAVIKGHTKAIYCLAITNDNIHVVSGSADNTIRVWNILKKQQITILQGHINGVVSIVLSRDNTLLVSGSVDKTVKVWNFLEKKQETEFLDHTETVCGVAITSDNKFIISVSSDITIKIWNLSDKQLKEEFEAHEDIVNCVSITNDYKFAVSGSGSYNSKDKRVIVWNLINKKQEAVLEGHKNGVLTVAISNDKRFILTGSWDYTIRIWNFVDKTQEGVLIGHTGAVKSIAIESENILAVSGSYDMTVRIWNLVSKKEEVVLKGHTAYVNSVAITNCNQCSSISINEFIIWDLISKTLLVSLQLLNFCFFNLDESIFVLNSSSDLNTIYIWNLNQKRQEGLFKEYIRASLISIDITRCNRYLVLGFKEKVIIRKVMCSKQDLMIKSYKKKVNYAEKINDKRLACNKSVKDYMKYNLANNNYEALLHGYKERILEKLYTKDCRFVVSYNFYTVRVWNLESQKLKAFLYLSDNIQFRGVAISKLENAIYLNSGLGISVFSIDDNTLEHELFFDKKLEELFKIEPSFEDYLPKIAYIDRN